MLLPFVSLLIGKETMRDIPLTEVSEIITDYGRESLTGVGLAICREKWGKNGVEKWGQTLNCELSI